MVAPRIPTDTVLAARITRKTARGSRAIVRSKIPSKTLRKAMNLVFRRSDTIARYQIPHYWALYLHDGTGPFNAKPGSFMVWYKQPGQDPRLKPPPVRRNQVRRLSRVQFLRDLKAGRLVLARRRRAVQGKMFWSRIPEVEQKISSTGQAELKKITDRLLKWAEDDPNSTITIRIG